MSTKTTSTRIRATRHTVVSLPSSLPRNPLALAARARLAGRHGMTPGGQRQQAQRELRRALHGADGPDDRPCP